MILSHICARLKSTILTILTLFKRAMCFTRRRRNSYAECEVLNSVSVVENKNYSSRRNEKERDWNSWDDTPRTVDEHIEYYRQKLAEPPAAMNREPEIDFFQDMTPKIIKQTKILLPTTEENLNFTRLQANQTIPIPITADLEDWHDDSIDGQEQSPGWDELNDEKTKQLIRESRKAAHIERQQKMKNLKMQQSAHGPGQKLVSK